MDITLRDTQTNTFLSRTFIIKDIDALEHGIIKDDTRFRTVKFKVFGTVIKCGIAYSFHIFTDSEEEARAVCAKLENGGCIECTFEKYQKI